MHLCMQDDKIGPKIVALAPADMAKLHTPFHNYKKMWGFFVVNKLACQLWLHLGTLNLTCFIYKENRLGFFLLSPSSP
jgi:hypothetical protein